MNIIGNYLLLHLILGNDHREAKILMSIVVVFVVCQSFPIVADTYEALSCINQNANVCLSNDHIENIIDISHFMLSINSSVNFLLYVIHAQIFRDAFIKVTMLTVHFYPRVILLEIYCQQRISSTLIFILSITDSRFWRMYIPNKRTF